MISGGTCPILDARTAEVAFTRPGINPRTISEERNRASVRSSVNLQESSNFSHRNTGLCEEPEKPIPNCREYVNSVNPR